MAQICVIVPIYKVQPFLRECLDSIRAQTFSDFECILVDDGSPDDCPQICDEYSAEDTRFRVIHQKNGGLSAARNSGIRVAQSPYLAFIDSDDVVRTDYLEVLYEELLAVKADIAVCGVEDVMESGESQPTPAYTLPEKEGVLTGRDVFSLLYRPDATYYTVAWNKLYKAELWRDLRYPEGYIHEDDAVAHQLYANAKTVVCTSKPCYRYRLRSGSICRTDFKPAMFDGVIALANRYRFCLQNQLPSSFTQQTVTAAVRRYLSLCAPAAACEQSDLLHSKWGETRSALSGMTLTVLKNPQLTFAEKLSFMKWK